jgi:protein-S-isoprenylcysteine O-methyltransferase Ste14
MMTATNQPKLLKQRQTHTRWFALLLIPLIIFSIGMLKEDDWQEEVMDWVGFFLTVICVLGRSYCTLFIGGIKNKTVVRQGPFSIVRNPLYVFSFIGLVGIGLQTTRFTLFLLFIIAFIAYYYHVVRKEEAFLLDRFGEDFQRYMQEVPRWFPKWSLWNEPEETVTRPGFVRQTMLDAMAFFIPWPCFELLSHAHEHGWLPTLILP